jgi:dTDP-4-dehydrorhamnose 3,5-epimerase
MVFTEAGLSGAFFLDIERHTDERGFFARTWCRREFAAHGLKSEFVQGNISQNRTKGTLRGMHYQAHPHEEAKLVRCTRGAVYDVIIDLRPDSATFLGHVGTVLSDKNHRALYVPEGFAHGFLTLTDDAEVAYEMAQFYEGAAGRGVRWNDPAFGISWPEPVVVISERDRTYPDFQIPARARQQPLKIV